MRKPHINFCGKEMAKVQRDVRKGGDRPEGGLLSLGLIGITRPGIHQCCKIADAVDLVRW